MYSNKLLVHVLFVLCLGYATSKIVPKSDRSDFKKSLLRDCEKSYSITCFKLDVVSWVDRLSEQQDMAVLPGVSVVKENGTGRANTASIVAELAREFPNDPDARLDGYLLKKVESYLNSHSIKLNLMGSGKKMVATARGHKGDDDDHGGGGGGGGGKGHKGNKGGKGGGGGGHGYEYLLAGAAMMKGTMMTMAMGAMAMIAGKALMTGLISLLLSTIIGLKSLTSKNHKQTTYEIVSKPIYSQSSMHTSSHEEHGGHGYSSYGRSFDTPLPSNLQPVKQ